MADKIKSGQYFVRTDDDTPRRDPPKDWGVIKGKNVNNEDYGPFDRHMGVSKSKWYTYSQEEHSRQYYDRSGTGVLSVVSLECEHSSKKKAVESAKKGRCVR